MTEISLDRIIHFLEEKNPPSFAKSWDNVGLQIGDRNKAVKKIFVALDATDAIIEEAIENRADLIITHHPLIFKPLKNVNTDNFIGRRVIRCIENSISLYSMHTNYDICNMGRLSGEYLKLKNMRVLDTTFRRKVYKIAVYVPDEYAGAVSEVMCNAGAGRMGEYSHCTFQASGIGSFKPLKGTRPFIGTIGEMEHVKEIKVEMIVPEGKLEKVRSALLLTHPYEVPAYDIFELLYDGGEEGIGRIGDLPEEMSVRELAEYVKKQFSLHKVQVFGDLERRVERVAISPGSGKTLIDPAVKKSAQVLITGDVGYNDGIDAAANSLSIIDAGHYGLEHIFINHMKEVLRAEFEQIPVLAEVIRQPVQTL